MREELESREGRALPVPHCIRDTPGWELYAPVKLAVEELTRRFPERTSVLTKATFGLAPEDTAQLRRRFPNLKTITVVGLVSNICVLSNAVCLQAAFPEAQVVVDAALTASFDPKLHRETLDVLAGLQVRVRNRPED